ncbi:excalibur calcium-binding domain-containing protein [Actinomycetospora chiangmaiensis]|uniref:excalibur calcium-binding domain-containing protein n=1 Tax=Actinomycetospora chiangmaiensis TaxID=402650 RepID=UPI0003AB11D4|nr:excalibur calcium-binding domain-containing protein [Actinomycetospora chiangmaiensis]
MIRPSRVGPLVIAMAAGALLFAGPAAAADPPVVGSAECDALVAKDPGVVAAGQGSAGGLPDAKQKAEAELCSTPAGTTSSAPSSSTSTPPPSSSPSSAPAASGRPSSSRPAAATGGTPPNRPGRPAGDRDCADFATQQQAQQYFESIGGSATNNADRLDENHNGIACESLGDDGDNQDAEATTTGDDGSTAKTSGDQVTEVPEGSAQTGGA